MPTANLLLPSAQDTELLGLALADALPAASAGIVLHLSGELGAGKTTCVRSLLRALSIAGTIRSPTYTLVETYHGAARVCVHVDLYRVQSVVEIDELGLRDMLDPTCLMLIEWPERGGDAIPAADLQLMLAYEGEARRARLLGRGPLGSSWLEKLLDDTRLTPYLSNLT